MESELQAAIDMWQRATDDLLSVVGSIALHQWLRPGPYPNWSNKDVLAHLATGYVVRLALLRSLIETGRPDATPDADAANARNVEARRHTSVEDLIAEMVATRGMVLHLMRRLQPDHLDVVVEFGDTPARLGAALLDFSRHDREHAADLA